MKIILTTLLSIFFINTCYLEADLLSKYKSGVIKLEKDLSFAKGINWEDIFYNTYKQISVLPNNKILVSNFKENNLTLFSKNGKKLKTIGQRGKGPGDFYHPRGLSILDNKYVLVTENPMNRKISVVNLNGKFIKVIKTEKTCFQIAALSDNKLAYTHVLSSTAKKFEKKIQVIIKDLSTNKETLILSKTIPFKSILRIKGGIFVFPSHTGEFFIRSSKDKNLLVAYSGENKIYEYNNKGTLIKTIVLQNKAVPVTSKYIKDMKNYYIKHYENANSLSKSIKRIDFSQFLDKNLPYYRDISIDEEGNIILLDWNKDYFDKNKHLSIYNSDGKFICKCSIDENGYETEFEHYCFTKKGIFCLAKAKEEKDDEETWPEIIKIK